MTKFRIHQRTGITLIEMVTVMSVFSVLLVINTKWLHQSIKFASTTKNYQRMHQNFKRLSSELRDDVRQCKQMSIDIEKQLTLKGDQKQTTTYTIEGMEIWVEKQDGNKIIFRDHFDLGPRVDVRWDQSEMPDWISLVVSRRPPGSATSLAKGNVDATASVGNKSNNHSPPLNRLPPIELHVRTGPNPWQ